MKQTLQATAIVLLLLSISQTSHAFWGSDPREKSSGLDVAAGYDSNTVTTLRGTVMTLPAKSDGSDHTEMNLATPQGTVTVLLGPWSYWERQNFVMSRDQEISITGSKAQGKDGSQYLFAQKLQNSGNDSSITLRSDAGVPAWSRGGSGAGSGAGQMNGRGSRGGAGYRGADMRNGGRR
ncbi:MAG TPA: DNA-binding protein [Desulfuromonadales bacterium]|nr:DNA-binding protein [Desulfuromonadales bacterium]